MRLSVKCRISACIVVGFFSVAFAGNAAWAQSSQTAESLLFAEPARVQGAANCSSTACHGGAGDQSRQYVLWSQRDVHSRAFATLATARAARMAEALRIADPATNARCIACHAPLGTISPGLLTADARVDEGVSCVSCHGPADRWLRSHTRTDYSHAERVAAGMRDLRDLRLRANTCIACHQNIDSDLIKVGRHPVLVFELDGQAQAEPKHWHEVASFGGAQAWYVGQAVAWREMSWSLLHSPTDAVREPARWQALRWLLQRAGLGTDSTEFRELPAEITPAVLNTATTLADVLATRAAQSWDSKLTWVVLTRLAATADDFAHTTETKRVLAWRSEFLVMAFDRLLGALSEGQRPVGASAQLDRLFRLVQSAEDFAPADFAREVAVFAQLLERGSREQWSGSNSSLSGTLRAEPARAELPEPGRVACDDPRRLAAGAAVA